MGVKIYNNPTSRFLREQALDGINRHVPGLYGYLPQNVPVDYIERTNGTIEFQI